MEILNGIFSILLVALLGVVSRKAKIFTREHIRILSAFVYYFGLPALFFSRLATTDFFTLDYSLISGSLLPVLLGLAILLLLKLCRVITRDTFILLSLSISFGSYAFFGVAFFETAAGGKWLAQAMVTVPMLGICGIVSSLTLFEYATRKGNLLLFVRKIVTNPLILAITLGVLCSLSGLRIGPLSNALDLLGKSAGGTAIFVLGIYIYDNFSLRSAQQALYYALFRCLALPLATLFVILLTTGQHPDTSQFLFLQSGVPSAISLAVFAERYDYHLPILSGVVILTSLFSVVNIMILFYLSEIMF